VKRNKLPVLSCGAIRWSRRGTCPPQLAYRPARNEGGHRNFRTGNESQTLLQCCWRQETIHGFRCLNTSGGGGNGDDKDAIGASTASTNATSPSASPSQSPWQLKLCRSNAERPKKNFIMMGSEAGGGGSLAAPEATSESPAEDELIAAAILFFF
jgi:hypothetical protein